MKQITLFGAGLVGRTIADELSKKYQLIIVDNNKASLGKIPDSPSVEKISGDAFDDNIFSKAVRNSGLAVCAVPGFLGYRLLKKIISAGLNVVDISFFAEDPFSLDELAKRNNVTAIVDCGIAPGFSNIILGYYDSKIKIKRFECYVGGLPFERKQPFEYKAPFSPSDVIEEYTRPARIKVNGTIIIKEALSDIEIIELPEAGKLEAFNSDGLRSLLATMDIPDMIEKTLRYPGHAEKVKLLRDSGFFSKDKIDINGVMISPLELTEKILFGLWKLEPEEEEFTVLRVIMEGREGDEEKRIVYDVFDRYERKTGHSSMARTTGYTATAAVDLVLSGMYAEKGISPPEFIGRKDGCFNFVMNYLSERGISIHKE